MPARTAIIYGESKSSKTTQLYLMAKWLKKKWEEMGYDGKNERQRSIRIITGDGGGTEGPFIESGMVDEGFVEILDITSSNMPYAEVNAVSEGKWFDGKYNPKGENKWRYTLVPIDGVNYAITVKQPNRVVGAYFVESLDTIAELWKNSMSHDPSGRAGFELTRPYTQGDYTVSGLQQGHYGIIQGELRKVVTVGFNQLPVEYVMYTSGIARMDGDKEFVTKDPILGPATAGKAQAKDVPRWVMDCFNMEDKIITMDGNNYHVKVAWMRNHPSPSGVELLAGVRVIPDRIPEFQEKWKQGFITCTYQRGIDQFYEWIGKK